MIDISNSLRYISLKDASDGQLELYRSNLDGEICYLSDVRLESTSDDIRILELSDGYQDIYGSVEEPFIEEGYAGTIVLSRESFDKLSERWYSEEKGKVFIDLDNSDEDDILDVSEIPIGITPCYLPFMII